MDTFIATHPTTGQVKTRRSDADYTHAVFHNDGRVSFHTSHRAAYNAATATATVVEVTRPVDLTKAASSPLDPWAKADEGRCTVVIHASGERCLQPGVQHHTSRSGEVLVECADHAL